MRYCCRRRRFSAVASFSTPLLFDVTPFSLLRHTMPDTTPLLLIIALAAARCFRHVDAGFRC